MDLSRQDMKRLRLIAESDPNLKQMLDMYEQLTAFGGGQQEENDRRWSIMVEAEGKMTESEKPKTMGAHRDLLEKFGFRCTTPVPKKQGGEVGHFGDFMEKYGAGGLELMSEYEMKSATAPKPRCDECRKLSSIRCRQCGEHYCSRACQIKARPLHKRVCKAVAAQRVECTSSPRPGGVGVGGRRTRHRARGSSHRAALTFIIVLFLFLFLLF
ncbi:hypothetical protein M758_10G063400 [Ceratodon purpureus]|nr:hypothetical protein M758_10G063400 [Ceratodon purpureus]